MFTAVHWLILYFNIPVFVALPYWFFPFREQTIGMSWIAVAATALMVAAKICFSKVRIPIKLGLLIFLGVIIQLSFAFSKGSGLDGIRDRMVKTGHAEFAIVAVDQESILNVAKNYEEMATSGELGSYAQSKPPGTLLFYMLSEKIANLFEDTQREVQYSLYAIANHRLESLRTFASLAWPWLSYLVLVPMYFLAQMTLDPGKAVVACLLYLGIPSVFFVTEVRQCRGSVFWNLGGRGWVGNCMSQLQIDCPKPDSQGNEMTVSQCPDSFEPASQLQLDC